MRPERMLSGCNCSGSMNGLKGNILVGQKDQADDIFNETFQVSELNTITSDTPNLHQGLLALVSKLGIDSAEKKALKIFELAPNTQVANGLDASSILYVFGRFIELAQKTNVLASPQVAKIKQQVANQKSMTLGDYIDLLESDVSKEKGKENIQARMDAHKTGIDTFTRELLDYLKYDNSTKKFQSDENARNFFEFFIEKQGFNDGLFGLQEFGRMGILEKDGKQYDTNLLSILVGIAMSYATQKEIINSIDVKNWSHKIAIADTKAKEQHRLGLSNAEYIEITRNLLGWTSGSKWALGLGVTSILGLVGYQLMKK